MDARLHSAVKRGDLQQVRALLAAGLDPAGLDEEGHTALWYVMDSVVAGHQPVDTGYYLWLAVTKAGGTDGHPGLQHHLQAQLDGLDCLDEFSDWMIRRQMKLEAPAWTDPPSEEEEPVIRLTADDTPVRMCDWERTPTGFRIWVIEHPHVSAVGADIEDTLEELIYLTLELLEDCEPNVHFVRPLPSDE